MSHRLKWTRILLRRVHQCDELFRFAQVVGEHAVGERVLAGEVGSSSRKSTKSIRVPRDGRPFSTTALSVLTMNLPNSPSSFG